MDIIVNREEIKFSSVLEVKKDSCIWILNRIVRVGLYPYASLPFIIDISNKYKHNVLLHGVQCGTFLNPTCYSSHFLP